MQVSGFRDVFGVAPFQLQASRLDCWSRAHLARILGCAV